MKSIWLILFYYIQLTSLQLFEIKNFSFQSIYFLQLNFQQTQSK